MMSSEAGPIRRNAPTPKSQVPPHVMTNEPGSEPGLSDLPLRRSEAVHRALLEGMLDAVVTIDDHGTMQHASKSVASVLGYRPEELVGKNIKMLMPEPQRSEHDGYLAHYRDTGLTKILGTIREFQAVRKDRGLIEVELSVARVDIEGVEDPLFVGCFRDVTERNRARQTERSMLRALAALGESSAILAHEIKNPVTAINLALRAVARNLGEDEKEVLEDLVRRMKRLEQQLRQSLSFAKPLQFRMGPCTAEELFENVLRAQEPILKGAGIEVEVRVADGTPTFVSDLERLEEVLTNLVVNAVEMLPVGGKVLLWAKAEDDEMVCLCVEDDGPGVAPSVRDTIFKPFVTTKECGTGLGLPICRRIVEELGATIDTQDEGQLGGACFYIKLPSGRFDERMRTHQP